MEPRRDQLKQVQTEVVTYLRCLAMVASGYVVVDLAGALAGGCSSALALGDARGLARGRPLLRPADRQRDADGRRVKSGKLVACGGRRGDLPHASTWSKGYVITPMVYGRAVKLDPVTILSRRDVLRGRLGADRPGHRHAYDDRPSGADRHHARHTRARRAGRRRGGKTGRRPATF